MSTLVTNHTKKKINTFNFLIYCYQIIQATELVNGASGESGSCGICASGSCGSPCETSGENDAWGRQPQRV